ncbi:PLAC8 family domain containing protein [Nitzschia inconspicua]|uniref:PLAC8 family domain containing protein n=1 Tax=Nitzschia inconspicua TaxID=303405 RepID=A0A9K3LZ63_9STRA|nr:PLAC8 family domain containing protein [Nitzschia inconspicua]KAG7371243.1 PLAC8 family domain containing protein [Nitzschia inconspicua]
MYHRRQSPSQSRSSSTIESESVSSCNSSSTCPSSRSDSSSPCRRHHRTATSVPLISSPSKDSPTMTVEGNGPASLSEGVVFWATITRGNDATDCKKPTRSSFPVRVPIGGVESGQTWLVPIMTEHDEGFTDDIGDFEHNEQVQQQTVQYGQWRDGLCSCFRHGLCHPHIWNAWLCPQILLGQLLVRMKMTWIIHNPFQKISNTDNSVGSASDGNNNNNNNPNSQTTASSIQSVFRKIMVLAVLLSLYDATMSPPLFDLQMEEDTGEFTIVQGIGFPVWHQILYLLLSLPMTVWGIVVVVRLRAAIRHKHNIPPGRLGQCEDFLCVCCCNCCVMSQMARQTADYDGDEPASCCSPNGIRIVNKKVDCHDDFNEEGCIDGGLLCSPIPFDTLSSSSSRTSTLSSSSSHTTTNSPQRIQFNGNNDDSITDSTSTHSPLFAATVV